MRLYLTRVTIFDGNHEHFSYALFKANTLEEAHRLVAVEIEKQDNEDPFEKDDESQRGYWSYGDGLTRTELLSVEALSKSDVAVLRRLSLVSFVN